jgi:hypothetical protein
MKAFGDPGKWMVAQSNIWFLIVMILAGGATPAAQIEKCSTPFIQPSSALRRTRAGNSPPSKHNRDAATLVLDRKSDRREIEKTENGTANAAQNNNPQLQKRVRAGNCARPVSSRWL